MSFVPLDRRLNAPFQVYSLPGLRRRAPARKANLVNSIYTDHPDLSDNPPWQSPTDDP
jgi:hypothetical protein